VMLDYVNEEENIVEEHIEEEDIGDKATEVAEKKAKQSKLDVKEEKEQKSLPIHIPVERDPKVLEETRAMPRLSELFKIQKELGRMTIKEVKTLMKVECEIKKLGSSFKAKYISWVDAWMALKQIYPNANITIYENREESPLFKVGTGGLVKVGVTVKGLEHVVNLPVMDNNFKSIKYDIINSRDVSDTIQRATAKSIALHGLGLVAYRKEDFLKFEDDEK